MIRRFARPYARAILEVAGSAPKANEVRAELARFEEMVQSATDLQDLYANPGVAQETKLAVTETMVKRAGLSSEAAKVIEVLIQNHRINQLAAVIDALTALVNRELDIVIADVRSAHELSAAEQSELKATLERRVGKKVDLRLKTDKQLLGGFVAQIGSEIYDASVAGKISKFRRQLA